MKLLSRFLDRDRSSKTSISAPSGSPGSARSSSSKKGGPKLVPALPLGGGHSPPPTGETSELWQRSASRGDCGAAQLPTPPHSGHDCDEIFVVDRSGTGWSGHHSEQTILTPPLTESTWPRHHSESQDDAQVENISDRQKATANQERSPRGARRQLLSNAGSTSSPRVGRLLSLYRSESRDSNSSAPTSWQGSASSTTDLSIAGVSRSWGPKRKRSLPFLNTGPFGAGRFPDPANPDALPGSPRTDGTSSIRSFTGRSSAGYSPHTGEELAPFPSSARLGVEINGLRAFPASASATDLHSPSTSSNSERTAQRQYPPRARSNLLRLRRPSTSEGHSQRSVPRPGSAGTSPPLPDMPPHLSRETPPPSAFRSPKLTSDRTLAPARSSSSRDQSLGTSRLVAQLGLSPVGLEPRQFGARVGLVVRWIDAVRTSEIQNGADGEAEAMQSSRLNAETKSVLGSRISLPPPRKAAGDQYGTFEAGMTSSLGSTLMELEKLECEMDREISRLRRQGICTEQAVEDLRLRAVFMEARHQSGFDHTTCLYHASSVSDAPMGSHSPKSTDARVPVAIIGSDSSAEANGLSSSFVDRQLTLGNSSAERTVVRSSLTPAPRRRRRPTTAPESDGQPSFSGLPKSPRLPIGATLPQGDVIPTASTAGVSERSSARGEEMRSRPRGVTSAASTDVPSSSSSRSYVFTPAAFSSRATPSAWGEAAARTVPRSACSGGNFTPGHACSSTGHGSSDRESVGSISTYTRSARSPCSTGPESVRGSGDTWRTNETSESTLGMGIYVPQSQSLGGVKQLGLDTSFEGRPTTRSSVDRETFRATPPFTSPPVSE